jgi:hypothetical protein
VTKFITNIFINWVAPQATTKLDLLYNKPASEGIFQTSLVAPLGVTKLIITFAINLSTLGLAP